MTVSSIRAVVVALLVLVPPVDGRSATRPSLVHPSGTGQSADQSDFVEISARVTAVAGLSVYLDAGSRLGVQAGDRAMLYPAGGVRIEAQVVSVSGSSSRVLPYTTVERLDIGTRAAVLVPAARLERAEVPAEEEPGAVGEEPNSTGEDAPPALDVPQHPAWTEPPREWAEGTPLLARVRPRTSAERESTFSGRVFLDVDATRDDESGTTTSLARTGVDARWRNPAGRGGVVQLDAEVFDRSGNLAFDPDTDEFSGRVDRLSYAFGGSRRYPTRVQAGRFIQRGMPEFGLLDGIEVAQKTDGGDLYGASAGFLPQPSFELSTGDDFQVAGFYRWKPGTAQTLEVSAGLQKSWHRGVPDRDLLVVGTNWTPEDSRYSTFASAWVDFYSDSDVQKDKSVELTELHWSHRYGWAGSGAVVLDATHLRWPELKRAQFLIAPETITNGELTRVGLSGWKRLDDDWRLSGRVDAWEDEQFTGNGGEIRASRADVPIANGESSASVFRTESTTSEIYGVRLQSMLPTETGRWMAAYEVADFDFDSATTQASTRHFVRLGWDTQIGSSWNLSLHAEARFGGSEDAHALGFSLQRRLR